MAWGKAQKPPEPPKPVYGRCGCGGSRFRLQYRGGLLHRICRDCGEELAV